MYKSNSKIVLLSLLALLAPIGYAYIDVSLQVATSSSDVAFNFPVTINSQKYHICISLQNKEDFIVSPNVLKNKQKLKKQHSKTLSAQMHVSSLQGYTLQGWKRFFYQVFLFIDPHYSHTLHFDLTDIKQTDRIVPLTNGLMSLGPKLSQNRFFNHIKQQTKDYFKDNIVSLYTAPGSKQLRMQLGGFEEQNARGYRNGIRFYQKPIEISADGNRWLLPVTKLIIAKEKGKKWDCYVIPWSAMKPKLSVQSQYVIVPETLKEDLETSFQSENTQCSFSETSSQLQCSNISSIDQALTFLSFQLDDQITINISLYDLRDQYNSKEKITSFFVKLGSGNEIQVGAPLLKGYYVSLNMDKPSILFSPINRFTPEFTTVSILRFMIVFLLFMISACICIIIWQQFNNPELTRRFRHDKNGVRLVSYQRPSEFEEGQ